MKVADISEIIHEWTGWCPVAGVLRTAPPAIATSPVSEPPGEPDRTGGGSGRRLIRPAILLVLLLTAVITLVLYPAMPDVVASHWNAAGDLNGTMPKLPGLALIPLLMGVFCGLLVLLPRIDPLRENYRKFQGYYDGFILVLAVFFFLLQLQIILWGLGIRVSPNLTMPVMIGLLFIYTGFLLEHAEPNWFIGIRTPWTLSSPSVWRKTHAMGAKLFKLAGGVSMIGVLAGTYAWLFILIPAIAVAACTVVYSYREFRKEQAAATAG
jgi:uncharacterized membrane protein